MNKLIVMKSSASNGSVPQLLTIALLLALLSSTVAAQILVETDKIKVDNVNLRAEHFLKLYMSNDANERKNAELYLLGVMDATEGRSWCDYRTFKTITLRERIFEEFKKLDNSGLNKRASKVIEDILSRRYHPCGRKK